MKKILILETYPFSPHLETSGEIALTFKEKYKYEVYFGWLGQNLEWAEWHLSKIKNFFYSYERRIRNFTKILEKKKINNLKIRNYRLPELEIDNWSKGFKGDIYDLKKYLFRNQPLGVGAASSLISYLQESKPCLIKHKKLVTKLLADSAKIFLITQKIIKFIKPDLVITFNGRFASSRAISAAAKNSKVKIKYHERGSSFEKYEIFDNTLHLADYRKKIINNHWKKGCKKKYLIAKSFYEENKSGKRKNALGLSFIKNDKFPEIKNNKNQLIYTYFASTSYEWDAIFGYKEGNWKNEYEAIKNLILEIKKLRVDIKLTVRLHPFNKSLKNYKDINDIKKLCKKNNILLFDELSKINSYELIKKSHAVITYGSTIGAEAIYMNKPSITMRESFYSNSKNIYYALNTKQLRDVILNSNLKKKDNKSVLPFAYYMMTFGKNFKYYDAINYKNGFFCGKDLSVLRPPFKLIFKFKNFLKN
tara:strand:- start:1049 stop:2479 length:1431 start_codon:yes stop_codon:yes gene_type:complete